MGAMFNTQFTLIRGIASGFEPDWQIEYLAACLVLFGITYRYAARMHGNIQLKQGTVAAFFLTRALALVNVAGSCETTVEGFLLDCGGPFHIFTISMFLVGIIDLLESMIAFGGAAIAIERLSDRSILRQFPSVK